MLNKGTKYSSQGSTYNIENKYFCRVFSSYISQYLTCLQYQNETNKQKEKENNIQDKQHHKALYKVTGIISFINFPSSVLKPGVNRKIGSYTWNKWAMNLNDDYGIKKVKHLQWEPKSLCNFSHVMCEQFGECGVNKKLFWFLYFADFLKIFVVIISVYYRSFHSNISPWYLHINLRDQ